MNKLLVITGPTATGKTALAEKLAKKFAGEIISADSRQVYKGMDIGTGKDIPKDKEFKVEDLRIKQNTRLVFGHYDIDGIKIWGLDIVEPDYPFNVSDFVKYSTAVIKEIQSRDKLPIIVGGAGLYVKALIRPIETINIPPNKRLRSKLEKYSLDQLRDKLKGINPRKWEQMNGSDRKNPRRLIRTIEIATEATRMTVDSKQSGQDARIKNVLLIGLTAPYEYLYKMIDKRVDKRVQEGIVEEMQSLLKKGYPWRMQSLTGLGYREFKEYFLGASSKNLAPFVQKWKYDEHAFARRQMTFLRKLFSDLGKEGLETCWFGISKKGFEEQVFDRVSFWYST